jgi:hypothetical protein
MCIFFFDGSRVWTQNFMLAKQALTKQALYCLSHTSSLFCSGYFEDGLSQTICLDWPWILILLFSASQVTRISGGATYIYIFIFLFYFIFYYSYVHTMLGSFHPPYILYLYIYIYLKDEQETRIRRTLCAILRTLDVVGVKRGWWSLAGNFDQTCYILIFCKIVKSPAELLFWSKIIKENYTVSLLGLLLQPKCYIFFVTVGLGTWGPACQNHCSYNVDGSSVVAEDCNWTGMQNHVQRHMLKSIMIMFG